MTFPPAAPPPYPPYSPYPSGPFTGPAADRAPAPAAPGQRLGYHRLAHVTGRHRWWRPLLGTLFVLVAYVLVVGLLDVLTSAAGAAHGYPDAPDGTVAFGPLSGTAVDLLLIAAALPVVLLAVRWTGRRPAGTVSSVTGRLRWPWLGRCLLVALPVLALSGGAMLLLPAPADEPPAVWAGWEAFLPALALLLALVPFQAAAEEYLFRGWLLQAVGAFVRSPWAAPLPQAVLFAAAHGWGTPWGFADLLVYGAFAGWLTACTGGLEAAIGLHVVNNLFAFGVSAALVDGLASDETAADAPWAVVLTDLTGVALYVAAVLWLARRRPPARTAVATPPAPPMPPPAYGYPYGPYGPYRPVGGFPPPYHAPSGPPGPPPGPPTGPPPGPEPTAP
ncbi:lysostaphin resistance A-like protein [Streptomyces sp. NPDC086091]|uniref:CPBP family intramembrane glutamic endopeptidase n=1 Tax=Streptomyces sp. NPDC086091 TaxID=3365751 RepID=UPI003816E479